MKKYIPCLLSVCLIIVFSFLAAEKAPAQTGQKRDKPDTAGSVTTLADEPSPGATITTGRVRSIIPVLLGLISLVFGWRVRGHSAGGPDAIGRRSTAIIALVLGLIAMVLSVVHLATSTGGVGTGSGKAGAIVALVLGLIGTIFGGLAFRSRAE